MAWWFSQKWFAQRADRREQKAIATILGLLENEGREMQKLKTLLVQIQRSTDDNQKAQIYIQFERELMKYEAAERIIEALDKKLLKKTMFKGLAKKAA